jgi:acyl-CoA synthetase (AMP-forming)/AMP-acid ligase II
MAALRRNRERAPDTVAVRSGTAGGWCSTTWAELHDAALAVAGRARSVADRSPVVLLVDGTAASIATLLGLALAGVDLLLLEEKNSFLTDHESLIHRIGPSTVVGPARHLPEPFRYLSYAECSSVPTGFTLPPREPELLQLTSGSTGEPRVARQPLRNVLAGGRLYRELFGLTHRDTVLATVPLAHSFGLVGGLFAALVSGATLCPLTRFDPRRALDGLDSATVLLGTPLVYQLLAPLLRTRPAYPRLRTVLSSGGPLRPDIAAGVADSLGRGVRQIYGSTETGLVACGPETTDPAPEGSVGHPAPGVEVRVEPADGRLLVRTSTMFTGYLGGPDRTGDGFYDTGDVARVDGAGRLVLTGRKSTFVNVGGRKVNPRRIERILAGHPGVREAFVYGDSRTGEEEIVAAVVLVPGTRVEDVVAFCRSRGLMPFEVPHRVDVWDALPRNGMGKVERLKVAAG